MEKKRGLRTWGWRLVPCVLGVVLSGVCFADLCVWRDPEKTMAKIFPDAKNYRTHVEKIPKNVLLSIAEKHGFSWDEGEISYIPKFGFHFYEVLDAEGGALGHITALAGKGEFGAVEVVAGINEQGKIFHIYIQRMRERRAKDLRAPAFLDQFLAKGARDMTALRESFRKVEGAAVASDAVLSTVEKMLSLHEYFTSKEKPS
jgi:hypothetical protein